MSIWYWALIALYLIMNGSTAAVSRKSFSRLSGMRTGVILFRCDLDVLTDFVRGHAPLYPRVVRITRVTHLDGATTL